MQRARVSIVPSASTVVDYVALAPIGYAAVAVVDECSAPASAAHAASKTSLSLAASYAGSALFGAWRLPCKP